MFTVSLTYTFGLAEVDTYLDAHVVYLQLEYAHGHFIASGRKVTRTGRIILSCVEKRDELNKILAENPFNKAGIAKCGVAEFVPSIVAKGFEILQQ